MLLLLIDKDKTMKKVLSFMLTVAILLLFPVTSAKAVTVSPNTGTFSPNSEQTIAVLAAPPAGDVGALQLRLSLLEASIVPGSVSTSAADDNGYLTIGTCEGQKKYTEDEICIDFAKTGLVTTGDLLVQFKIKFDGTSGSAYVLSASGLAYVVGSQIVPQEESVLGEYTIVANNTPAPTQLPIAGIEDYPELVLILGLVTVAMGVGFFIWRNKAQNAAV